MCIRDRGDSVYITGGNYSGAELDVPSDVYLYASPSVTGITYASIGDGARIDEPAFNACFGGYAGGIFTVSTGSSAVKDTATWVLAFKPDQTIYYVATDASDVLTDINAGSDQGEVLFMSGTFKFYDPVTITKNLVLRGNYANSALSFDFSSTETSGLILKAFGIGLENLSVYGNAFNSLYLGLSFASETIMGYFVF